MVNKTGGSVFSGLRLYLDRDGRKVMDVLWSNGPMFEGGLRKRAAISSGKLSTTLEALKQKNLVEVRCTSNGNGGQLPKYEATVTRNDLVSILGAAKRLVPKSSREVYETELKRKDEFVRESAELWAQEDEMI